MVDAFASDMFVNGIAVGVAWPKYISGDESWRDDKGLIAFVNRSAALGPP